MFCCVPGYRRAEMAAGPIRGGFRPVSSTGITNSNSKSEGPRRSWRNDSGAKNAPYSRPSSRLGASFTEGVIGKLTGAVKKIFSFLYQSDQSQTAELVHAAAAQPMHIHIEAHQDKPAVPQHEPIHVGEPKAVSQCSLDSPTDILSDLILNPLYKQSKQAAFRQIGHFFQAKNNQRLTKYEFDQMASILRRLTANPVIVQQHFRYPLASGITSTAVYSQESPSKYSIVMERPVDQPESSRQDLVLPSRIFTANLEYDDFEDDDSLVSNHDSNKIFVPVPQETKLNTRRPPVPVRLQGAEPTKTVYIPAESASMFAPPNPVLHTGVSNASNQETPAQIKEMPKFFIPNLNTSTEPETKAEIKKGMFDFGPATIPDMSVSSKGSMPTGSIFNLGDSASAVKETSHSNALNENKAVDTKPGFSFGSNSGKDQKQFSFSFGDSKEASSSGLPAADKTSSTTGQPKPFVFNAPTTTDPVKSFAFTVPEKASEPNPTLFSSESDRSEQKPFSFAMSKPDNVPKPFTFGETKASEAKPFSSGDSKPSDSKPLFSFGGAAPSFSAGDQHKANSTAPADLPEAKAPEAKIFSFGSVDSSSSRPTTFGEPAATKPFVLGDSLKTAESKPFLFGQPSLTSAAEPKPFGFGDFSSKPFQFGASSDKSGPPITNEPKPTDMKPLALGDSLASKPTGTTPFSAAPFSFGVASAEQKAPLFGAQPGSKPFTFGGAPATENRSFAFGEAKTSDFGFSLNKDKTAEPASAAPFGSFGLPPASGQPGPFSFSQQPPAQTFSFTESDNISSDKKRSRTGGEPAQPASFAFSQPQVLPQPQTAPQLQTSFSFGQPFGSQASDQSTQPFGSQPSQQPFIFGQSDPSQSMTFNMGSSPAATGRPRSTPVSRRRIPK